MAMGTIIVGWMILNDEATLLFTQLPINNMSCICSGPPFIFVKYTNSTFSGSVRNLEQLGGYNPTNREYGVTVELTRALCWAQYNVSIAYGNTNGNSSWSGDLLLRGPLDCEFKFNKTYCNGGRGKKGGREGGRERGREERREGGREGGGNGGREVGMEGGREGGSLL